LKGLVVNEINTSQPSEEAAQTIDITTLTKKSPSSIPFAPNSAEEWELEIDTFNAAGGDNVPNPVRELIRLLWRQFVLREKWFKSKRTIETLSERISESLNLPLFIPHFKKDELTVLLQEELESQVQQNHTLTRGEMSRNDLLEQREKWAEEQALFCDQMANQFLSQMKEYQSGEAGQYNAENTIKAYECHMRSIVWRELSDHLSKPKRCREEENDS
jgi:hypothetical protein